MLALVAKLNPDQEAFVLSAFPPRSSIEHAFYFDNYNQPCPIRISIRLPSGKQEVCVLRIARHGSPFREAQILKALSAKQLPVAKVLAENAPYDLALYSLIEGENLQKIALGSKEHAVQAKKVLFEGIERLHEITGRMENDEVGTTLVHQSLASVLESITQDNPWLNAVHFAEIVRRLEAVLPHIETPLVFTNGDYQPANFLTTDMAKLNGIVDFEHARFEDPLIGFAKYLIYDFHLFNPINTVQDWLKKHGYSEADFAPRLALSCLLTLKREVPPSFGDSTYRSRIFSLLDESLAHF